MHTPQDEESKRLPFEEAASGAVALETLLPAAMRLYHAGQLDLPALVPGDVAESLPNGWGLPGGRLAALALRPIWCLFDPDAPFVMGRTTLQSKSKNTPFDGQRMQGKVLATYVAGQPVFRKRALMPLFETSVGGLLSLGADRLRAGVDPVRVGRWHV